MSVDIQTGNTRPMSILIAALGGEGGGVLLGWLIESARAAGLAMQATSVPGVAQRTGATSYYLEMMAKPASGKTPVFALAPVAGQVDVVLASELLESGRMIERGFVSPATTLITSASRVYTTAEKMHGGDGRFSDQRLHTAGQDMAGRYVALDLQALAQEHGTLISATLYGALAGAGVLPWPASLCEEIIGRDGGRRAQASIAGFRAACAAVAAPRLQQHLAALQPAVQAVWLERIARLPTAMQINAAHAVVRLSDYQDAAYAGQYLDRLAALDLAVHLVPDVAAEAARLLALWMSYEDVFRVADLKTAAPRFARIRDEAHAGADDIVTVTEHFKPGVDEIAAVLPKRLGRWLLTRVKPGTVGKGMHLPTSKVWGFTALRLLALFGRARRRSLRYTEEQLAIDAWLKALAEAHQLAPQVVRLPALRRGYGDTHARGLRNYRHLFDTLVQPALARGVTDADVAVLKSAIDAALADPEGPALNQALEKAGMVKLPVTEKPIIWATRQRGVGA